MSYCRWSSDDYQCDVYVYADCEGGYTTMVAERRHVFKYPLPPDVPIDDTKALMERNEIVNKMCDEADLIDIGLPCDGEIFNDSTPGECADRLEMLKKCGYNVPQYAIDELKEEEVEQEKATSFIPMEDK